MGFFWLSVTVAHVTLCQLTMHPKISRAADFIFNKVLDHLTPILYLRAITDLLRPIHTNDDNYDNKD